MFNTSMVVMFKINLVLTNNAELSDFKSKLNYT